MAKGLHKPEEVDEFVAVFGSNPDPVRFLDRVIHNTIDSSTNDSYDDGNGVELNPDPYWCLSTQVRH